MEKTVLVVDDIAPNRNLLRQTLEPRGYEVLLASNGLMALKVVERTQPDVILMDVNMPDMDGYEACRQLKSQADLATIPVIFITANDDPESLVRGFEAGGVDYIAKPFKEQEVLMRVETHVKIHMLTQALSDKNTELEAEVKRRKAAEDKANEANEAKSRFLSFISHEMRSPLNAIIGFSEELCDSLDQNGEQLEDAESIERSGKHLLGLINNLLDLSRIEAGKMPIHPEDFEPAELVRQLCHDAAPLVKAGDNQLVVESNGQVGTVHSDATKLKQVLLNLISNAGKFTKSGEIKVVLSRQGTDSVRIDVRDSGIGMSPDELGRLFQAYNQASRKTSKRYGGTGLGLVISRQYCRLLGGDLTATSQPGTGSVFTVTISTRATAGLAA
ncbi:MAG TPA: hybrid sensor histidine kinase/response regulator [Verrucomicrobiales bacterium]|nr:hybrid sensor histidine kinase/response regulator [Verrucomicrobiales bacterium]